MLGPMVITPSKHENRVTERRLLPQVTNTNKDTSLKWFKDNRPLSQDVYDQASGLSTLTITQVPKTHSSLVFHGERSSFAIIHPQVSQKDAGSYRAVVSDKRGEDVTTLNLLGDGETSWMCQPLFNSYPPLLIRLISAERDRSLPVLFVFRIWQVSSSAESTLWWVLHILMSYVCILTSKNNPRLLAFTPAAMSAGPLKIESTAEGFKLYCSLKYYINQLKTSWFFKWVRILSSSWGGTQN